jgi:hypothetical protein
MGRLSRSRKAIFIDCRQSPELHDRFYTLKKQAHIVLRRKLTNREYLDFLLKVFAERLAEEKRRRTVSTY